MKPAPPKPPPEIEVRPFATASDYERMIDYFVGGEEPFLRGMGVDPSLLPTRKGWLEACLADHRRLDAESEPYAENRAPNRLLERLGFRHVKRYRTVPSSIAKEQDVNRWVITREAWEARGR